MKEKVSNTKLIYKGKILNLRLDEVILPNGKKTTREIIEHGNSVAILPLIDDKILFVEQYRRPLDKALLEIPAGRLEKGEDIEECAKRELEEETGYKAGSIKKLTCAYLAPGYSSELIHIFLAENLKKTKPNPDEDEFIKTAILDKKEALKKIMNREITDSKTIIGILFYSQNKTR